MSDSLTPQSPDPDEPDFQKMLSELLGSNADNPQLAEALKAMGIDRLDPAAMGMISAQLKAMFSSDAGEVFNAELATDVARKAVSAAGDASLGATARREVEEAAHVAGLWLDDVTQLTRARRGGAGVEPRRVGRPDHARMAHPGRARRLGRERGHRRGHARPDGLPRPLPAAAGTARRHGRRRDDGPDGADAGPHERVHVRRPGRPGRRRPRR